MNRMQAREFDTQLKAEPLANLKNEELQLLLESLQPSIWGNAGSGAKAIGVVWNGASDLVVEESLVKARDIRALLNRIRKVLVQKNDAGIELPTKTSVRSAESSVGYGFYCIVDLKIDEVYVPFGFSSYAISKKGQGWLDELEAGFVEHFDCFLKHRTKIVAREMAMREAFANLVERIGGECKPAWLRMATLDCRDGAWFDSRPYEYAMLILDDKLEVTLEGHRVMNARELRGLAPLYRSAQRRRADRRRKIVEARAVGLIDTVTEALIRHHGRDPHEVMLECAQLGRDCIHAHVSLAAPDQPSCNIWFRDGVLHCALGFKGGAYTSGDLMLDQQLPEVRMVAMKGRSLHEVVDHPVFVTCKPRISSVKRYGASTNIRHAIKPRLLYPPVLDVPRNADPAMR